VVLYVGRLSREKDLEVLFTAHRDCLGPAGAQLVIAGDGPLHRKVRRFACATAGVAYLGMRAYGDDLARLYRSADVLAVPGRYETFSLIVLEALASGLPVVAARQGGPAEILPGIGELAEPGDALDFGRKVLAVLREPLASSVYRDHVERLYSWEKTFDGLLELYRTLAGEKGGRRPVAALAEEDRLLLPSAARSA
jgi:alpha-1,6-mannosyltransferase